MKLSHISEQELKAYESDLRKFFEACSYSLKDECILIYINKLKELYKPKTLRNKLIRIRKFLKFINHPIAGSISIPRVPKRLKKVIKIADVRKLLEEINSKIKDEEIKQMLNSAILITATSGLRAEELYKLEIEDIDIENRTIFLKAEKTKDYEDRIAFFSEEAKQALMHYLNSNPDPERPFRKKSIYHHFKKIDSDLRLKHMRKFFSQQSDRLGMPTTIKKLLMGHSPRGDVDLNHYDFQDEEELRKIYDKYWRDFRILS